MRQKKTKTTIAVPITYHKFDDQEFESLASECGSKPEALREATEIAIRNRHHESRIEHPSHKANGRQPDILTLNLDLPRSVQVVYTVEPYAIVVRGYSWGIVGEPRDDRDGGYFYHDNHWMFNVRPGVNQGRQMTRAESETATTPHIYVSSFSDYNAGRLYGRWIDANQPASELHAEIRKMLAELPEPFAEEWAIHDYEGFDVLELPAFAGMDDVAAAAAGIATYGPVFAKLAARLGGLSGLVETRKYFEEGYRGKYKSLAEYGAEFMKDCYDDGLEGLPEFIRYYVDYEGFVHDMEMTGEIITFEIGGELHVFDGDI